MHQLGNLLQHRLARYVVWMSLSRENELNRPFGIIHHLKQLFEFLEDQIGTLVCRETSCKADGQRIGTERAPEPLLKLRRFLATVCLFDSGASDEFQQPRFEAEVRFPQLSIV